MRKNINKILICAAIAGGMFATSASNVLAEPDKLHGAKPMMVWDYHKSNYDKDGNLRTAPSRTTFSTEGNEYQRPEGIPELKSMNTKLGHNVEITFEDNASSRQWVNNVYRITVLDDLTENPNLQTDVIFKIENGKITLSAESRALTYNKVHRIKIYSTGYDAVEKEIHVVKDAPTIKIHPDFRPMVNNDILFELENFNYAITNPIYEVQIDGKKLEGDCVQYHVVSNLIRIEDEGQIKTPGLHTIKIKAHGFEDAELEFNVVEHSDVATGTFDDATLAEFSVVKLSNNESGGETQQIVTVDAISSASTGGSGGSGGSGGGSGSMIIRANLVFDFDMVANAYILRDLGMQTEESERVRMLYELSTKDAATKEGINRKIDWSGFTNAYLKKQAEGEYLTFEEYINSPEAEDYIDTPYYMKNVLEDGYLGEEFLANEALLTDAPEVRIDGQATKGKSIVISADDSKWMDNIVSIRVGTTVLRESEYEVEGNKLTLKENRFSSGLNRVQISSYGYKTKSVMIDVIKSEMAPVLKENPKVDGIFEVVSIDAEYGKSVTGISLNGRSLYSREGVGIEGDYAVYSDKIVFSKHVIKDTDNKILTIKAYGYEDVVITFKPDEKVVVNPGENVVPEMTINKGALGESVTIRFDKDNPLWRDAFKGIKKGIFTVDKSKYSIGSEGITVDGSVFSKGMNTLTIEAEGYDDEVLSIYFVAEHPVMEVKKASLENGVEIDCSEWDYLNDVTAVYVDGVKLSSDKYDDVVTKLTIDKSVFTSIKTYSIKIEAEDYKTAELNVVVKEKDEVVSELKEAPAINSFGTFKAGEDMEIDLLVGLKDYTEWFNNLVVKVDGTVLAAENFEKKEGSVVIKGNVISNEKTYEVMFESEGYKPLTGNFQVIKEQLKQPYEISETYIYNTESLEVGLGDWGSNISEIKIQLDGQNEKVLVKDTHYFEDTSNGRLIIKGDNFNKDGWVDIWIKSEGYRDLSHRLMIKSKMVPSSEIAVIGQSNIAAGNKIEISTPISYGETSYEVNTVKVNGSVLENHMYDVTSGKVTVNGENFPTAGAYTITLVAEKYEDKDIVVNVSGSVDSGKLDAPSVSADTHKNTEGKEIGLTFTDNEAWRNNINKVLINNEELWSMYLTKNPGELLISSSAFDHAGTYTIVIQAEGYKDVTVTQVIGEKVPDISTNLSNTTVNRETFDFYSKWTPEDSFFSRATKVLLNGTEVSPTSGSDFTVTLNEGENTIEVKIEEFNVSETYKVSYEKPVLVDGPSIVNGSIKLGESYSVDFTDSDKAWLEGIESITYNGETVSSSDYSINNSDYFGRSIDFRSYGLDEMGVYNVTVKSFPYNDVTFQITVGKKDAPSGVELEAGNYYEGDAVKVDISGGGYSNPYRDSITKVTIDGVETSAYSKVEGDSYGEHIMVLDGSAFQIEKTYVIVIESDLYDDVTITVTVEKKVERTTEGAISMDL